MKSVIRWPGLVAFIVIMALLIGIPMVFLDTWIKLGVERFAAGVNGAEVNVGRAEHRLFPFGITLHDVALTDPAAPSNNRVQLKTVSAGLAVAELLDRRLIVDDLVVDGVRFDQPRLRPGEVYESNETEVQDDLAAAEGKPRVEVDIDELLKKTPLATRDEAKKLQETANRLETKVTEAYKALPDEGKLESYKQQVDALREKKIESPADFAAATQELMALKDALRAEQQKLQQFKTTVSAAGEQLQAQTKALEAARKDDYSLLKRAVAGDTGALDELTEAIFGAKLKTWADNLMIAYNLVTPLLGGGEEETKHERLDGRWIQYTKAEPHPNVWIRNARISVKYSESEFISHWQDITEDHQLLGRPTRFTVESSDTDQWQLFNLIGDFSFGAAGLNAHQQWDLKGVAVAALDLASSSELTAELQKALLNSLGKLTVTDGELAGSADINFVDMTLKAVGDGANSQTIAKFLENLKRLDIDSKISGVLSHPQFDFASDLDSQLGQLLEDNVSEAAQAKLTELNQKLGVEGTGSQQAAAKELANWETLKQVSQGKTDTIETLLKAELKSAVANEKDKLKDQLKDKLLGN
ncbi:TIGR03545 family protein [Teredinibacter turnerae]|uniref:TIGR03545 family protein n=1 Tax=Teredinibacter turnerae TaxID=2426 RepID=UPI0030CFE05E